MSTATRSLPIDESRPHPMHAGTTGDPEMDFRVREMVEDWGTMHSPALIEELIITALRVAKDPVTTADLKLFNRTLREMRHAINVFEPYSQFRKITVFGSARTPPEHAASVAAEAFSRKMVDHGYMIITGGGDGIMGAAQRGAGRENSFGLNIRLPFEQAANEIIHGDPKLVNFNYFFTRKLNFLKESHAVVLFAGGFGTLDEAFETLTLMQTGKASIAPLVMIEHPGSSYWKTWLRFIRNDLLGNGLISEEDFHLFKITGDVDEAVREIQHFYHNFHSARWVRDRYVIRLKRPLEESAVANLNEEFADILISGTIEQRDALPQERDEEDTLTLKRLVLLPDRRNFGRFRQLINAVNDAPAQ